jgi:hypothetical protein
MEDVDKQTKKDMMLIIKENNKLKKELIEKNTIINSIVNQNVTEINTVKSKYEDILKNLMTSYDNNISHLNKSYDMYKRSLEKRMRDTVKTHYKLNNEKYDILLKNNDELNKKIKLHCDVSEQLMTTSQSKTSLELQVNDLLQTHQNYVNIISTNEKTISDLRTRMQTYESDIGKKYEALLLDNINKQNEIDVRQIEILNLSANYSKVTEINQLLSIEKKDMVVKNTDYLIQIDKLLTENASLHKTVNRVVIEKDNLIQEKDYLAQEHGFIKKELQKINLNVMDKTMILRADFENEKQKYIAEIAETNAKKMSELNDQIQNMQLVHDKYAREKEAQIKSLMDYIKSFTDNQHAMFCEIETLKSTNIKLSSGQSDIDQILSKIRLEYNTKLDDLLDSVSKEKGALVENYKENIIRMQETNTALEERLKQTIDALSLSRTTIANLKNNASPENISSLKEEISLLKVKLDKSIEFNNAYGNKEKQYELQIKQLQIKNNKLIILAKQTIDSNIV